MLFICIFVLENCLFIIVNNIIPFQYIQLFWGEGEYENRLPYFVNTYLWYSTDKLYAYNEIKRYPNRPCGGVVPKKIVYNR